MMKMKVKLLELVLIVDAVRCFNVSITLMNNAAISNGAVCLDGSAPAYHYHPGVGNGAHSWLIVLEGGYWCPSVGDCSKRIHTELGSSNLMTQQWDFRGVLSPQPQINPYFYNWNKVLVRYCDGASFSADVKDVFIVNTTTKLYMRGARIFTAIVDEFKNKGMVNAKNAILMVGSAGGLAAMLKCDEFLAQLPNVQRLKCISESGFFFGIDNNRLPSYHETYFRKLIEFHQLAELLPKSCTSKMDPRLCMFAENFVGDILTPLFIINSQFDLYQIQYMINHPERDTKAQWDACRTGTGPCKPESLQKIKEFQREFLEALPKHASHSLSRGLYIDSCATHDHSFLDYSWIGRHTLRNKSVCEAVGQWFWDHHPFQEIENVNLPYKC